MEALWLLSIVLVPLAFLDRDYLQSEAAISYVEVPKVALLRTLAALMAILWLAEWSVRGTLPITSFSQLQQFRPQLSIWWGWLRAWLSASPANSVILAVWLFLGTTILSTVLSGSRSVSIWGEIPGQDGYPAYTVLAYILLFGAVSTHLKTRTQLWRLLGAVVGMGTLVAGYAIFQHYGNDFLDLTEITGGGEQRVTAFMGNAIFAAAVLAMTLPVSLACATLSLRTPERLDGTLWAQLRPWTPVLGLAVLWGAILAIQLLGLTFTFSRGPWLGTIVAVVAFIGLAVTFAGIRRGFTALILLAITAAFSVTVLQAMGSISFLGSSKWISLLFAAFGVVGLITALVAVNLLSRVDLRSYVLKFAPFRLLVGRPVFGLAVIVAVLGLVSALVIMRLPSSVGAVESPPVTTSSQSTSAAVAERFGSIGTQVLTGFGGRGETWKASLRLVRDRPWFDFDNLSLGWLRPAIGYGPDLFRYTYLLESRPMGRDLLPEEPDHAHNYFLHQAVEQGYLGLLSTFAIIAAIAYAGGRWLLQHRHKFSNTHMIVLAILLAVLAGRFLEMMVGVARISDLTILWILLGVFVALPSLMSRPESQSDSETAAPTNQRQSRRPRRRESDATRLRRPYDPAFLWKLAVVAILIGVIVATTWARNINNVRAAVALGDAVEHFGQTDLQATLFSLDRAIDLAPNNPIHHNNRAAVYFAYQFNETVPDEIGCRSQNQTPYTVCLSASSLQDNLDSVAIRPFNYRSRLALANSAYNIPGLTEQTILFFQQAADLMPGSWPIRNELADAYLAAERPKEAVDVLLDSLTLTGGNYRSASAHYLLGTAYRDLGDLDNSARSLELSLELETTNPPAPSARVLLPEVYLELGNVSLAGEALANLGDAQQNVGDLVEAAATFGSSADAYRAAGLSNREAISLFAQGEIFHRLNEQENARQSFEGSVTADPLGDFAPQAYFFIGGAALNAGDIDAAVTAFTEGARAHRVSGNLGDASWFLAQILREKASPALKLEAHELFAEILQEQGLPSAAAGQLFLAGELELELKNLVEALNLFNESLSLGLAGDNQLLAYVYLSNIHASLGQSDEAERFRQLAPRAYSDLAEEAIREGKPDDAVARYIRGAEAHQRLGNLAVANAYLTQALQQEASPDLERLARELFAEILQEQGLPGAAADQLFLAGELELELKNLVEALNLLTASLDLGLGSERKTKAHGYLADIYERLGRPEEAEEQRRLAGN